MRVRFLSANFINGNNISCEGEGRKYEERQQRKHNERPTYFARHYNFLQKKSEQSNHFKSTPPMITNNGWKPFYGKSNDAKADILKEVRH